MEASTEIHNSGVVGKADTQQPLSPAARSGFVVDSTAKQTVRSRDIVLLFEWERSQAETGSAPVRLQRHGKAERKPAYMPNAAYQAYCTVLGWIQWALRWVQQELMHHADIRTTRYIYRDATADSAKR